MFDWVLSQISYYLYKYILIVLLVGCGIFFTLRTKFVQIRLLPEACRVLTERKTHHKSISSFQALMISTASRIGTGNIAGVCTAIALGGPGSVFWMWITALIGSASAFAESTLAQVYKVQEGNEYRGGPAYYIQKALGKRWLGILFSVMLICCFAYGFNALQAFNITSALAYYAGAADVKWISLIVGFVLALLTAFAAFGGMKRISHLTSVLVPVMALLYLGAGLFIILKNITLLPAAFSSILHQAFHLKAIFGGFAASGVMYGIKRGLFSNEAGMGSAPCAAASADVSHPAKQGLVQMLSVFIDTLLICTTTAMIILLSGVSATPANAGMPLIQSAIRAELGTWGIHFITLSIFLFAFSSIIGNYYYAEANLKFIHTGPRTLLFFRLSVILSIFFGAQLGFDTVWNAADILMGLMAGINIVALFCLNPIVIRVYQDYLRQKGEGVNPVFQANAVDIPETDVWK